MEIENDTLTDTQARNAAKVAGFAAVIGLTGTLAIKAQRAIRRRVQKRRLTPQHLTVEE